VKTERIMPAASGSTPAVTVDPAGVTFTVTAVTQADEDEATGWRAMAHGMVDDREEYEQRLRLTWEHEDDYDPLLGEIAGARNAMLQAEARMRLLIAYGREFTRPRPYRLEDLARAAGMSISGIRTAYDEDEVAEVAKLTGTRPRRAAEAR
jgi:hypothetical protein